MRRVSKVKERYTPQHPPLTAQEQQRHFNLILCEVIADNSQPGRCDTIAAPSILPASDHQRMQETASLFLAAILDSRILLRIRPGCDYLQE